MDYTNWMCSVSVKIGNASVVNLENAIEILDAIRHELDNIVDSIGEDNDAYKAVHHLWERI